MIHDPPLIDLRVIELGGIGPGPFCGMMLADHGATVLRIVRPGQLPTSPTEPLHRSRHALSLDLKLEHDLAILRKMLLSADVLIEGFRPGVLERLGLSPEILRAANPRLVIGRVTGWGQKGPRSGYAGHDLNYLATSGVLNALGLAGQRPTPPINLLADFGGGGMMLAFGVLAAAMAAKRTGLGDVVDAAMSEGASLLSSLIWGYRARDGWSEERGTNLLDTGAPFYDCYETKDGRWLAIAPIEPQFWQRFAAAIDLPLAADRVDPRSTDEWPRLRAKISERIAERSSAAWEAVFSTYDACVSPVLTFGEALSDEHNVSRTMFVQVEGVSQPAPVPRYDDAPVVRPYLADPADLASVLRDFGLTEVEYAALLVEGKVAG